MDPGFGSCFNDCDEDTIMLIYSLVEGCYNCLGDSTLDCADVFDDEDDSDEVGSPRESALDISVRRLTEDIVNEITNTW